MTIQMLLLILFYPALVGALVGIAVEGWRNRHNRILRRAINLDEEQQYDRELLLDAREQKVVEKEQELRRHAKTVAAVIAREHTNYDTMISRDGPPDLPHPNENAETIEMPAVKS